MCYCSSGGTTVTVTGQNVDAAAEPFINITVVVTRFSQDGLTVITQVAATSEVLLALQSLPSTAV